MFRLPIYKHEHGHQHHIYHRGNRPPSFKHVVTHDTANNRTGNSRDLVSRINPTHRTAIIPFHIFQISRGPIQYPVPYQVNKSIRNSDIPQYLIIQNVLEKNLFSRQLLFRLGTIILRIIITIFFDRRQPARLRGIPDKNKRNNHDHNSRENECRRLPRSEPNQTHREHDPDQTSPHVMGYIPDRHLRPSFFQREPVRHHPPARRPSHPLEPTDQKLRDKHHHDRGNSRTRTQKQGDKSRQ